MSLFANPHERDLPDADENRLPARDLLKSRGEAGKQMHVAFGRASTALSGKEKLGGPKEDTLLWKARDSLAQKKGSRHTVYATNGEEYTGEWLNNCKHGKGVMIYKNGDKYDGFWEQDRRHGQGSFFVKRGARLRLQYTGEWQDDKRWGLGTFNFINGDRYEGQWHNGRRTGWGTMIYKDGDRYEGEWIDGKREGFGTYYLANGDQYEGQWSNDDKEGTGCFKYISRNQRYDGEWVKGVPKCGALSELNPDEDPEETQQARRLPALKLEDPINVLSERIDAIRYHREVGEEETARQEAALLEQTTDSVREAIVAQQQQLGGTGKSGVGFAGAERTELEYSQDAPPTAIPTEVPREATVKFKDPQ
eukprot:TRINITY_DN570_c0_g4_i1.p1 TRINITY_DN570_c0_g4~~TRINITY_DN570_c0_g4_i1.p1  ORF type:complete len:364 (+),score=79.36 TRINITY_DN570_c0_g4_i1:370-1461(+)